MANLEERRFNKEYHLFCNRKGEVFSADGNPLKTRVVNGYPQLIYYDSVLKRYRGVTVAKLVALTFIPFTPLERDIVVEDEISKRIVVLHYDGDVTNNKADNLYWGTRSEAKREGWRLQHEGTREYKPRMGSIFYAAKTVHALESGCTLCYETTKELSLEGFNIGRVYTSAKYGRRYKGLYWKIVPKNG